jgi:hypothetical protein
VAHGRRASRIVVRQAGGTLACFSSTSSCSTTLPGIHAQHAAMSIQNTSKSVLRVGKNYIKVRVQPLCLRRRNGVLRGAASTSRLREDKGALFADATTGAGLHGRAEEGQRWCVAPLARLVKRACSRLVLTLCGARSDVERAVGPERRADEHARAAQLQPVSAKRLFAMRVLGWQR